MNNVVIFSLDTTNRQATAAEKEAVTTLLDATPILGCYNGDVENSFLVDFSKLGLVKELCKQFKQESILIVSDGARLLFLGSNEVKHLEGNFQQVDNTSGLDSYSIIDGNIYTIK